MKTALNIEFYQNVAKLFYAIAASDKTVRKEEFDKLKEIVQDQWLIVDDTEDEFQTDAAYQLEIVFDWLNNQESESSVCFQEFMDYKNNHNYFFTTEIKSLILKTANEIATAFYGKNKAELMMLAKLDIDFKKVNSN